MKFNCIFKQALKRRELRGSDLLVFMGILYYYNQQTDECVCSQSELSTRVRCSLKTVQRSLDSLEDAGIVRIERKSRGHRPNFWIKGVTGIHKNKAKAEAKDKKLQGMFDVFWKEYPHSTNKARTKTKFMMLCRDEKAFREIMHDVRQRVKGEWSDREVQYIPHSLTYLNNQRWLDSVREDAIKQGGVDEIL